MDGLFENLLSVEGGSGPHLSSGQRVSLTLATLISTLNADDIVLVSTTAEGLQRLINTTAQYCRCKCMTVSPAKTAVVVLRTVTTALTS